MDKPNKRECKVLMHFVGSYVEMPGAWGRGAGTKTLQGMIEKGWIEWVDDPNTNETGYRITKAGEKARNSCY